MSKFQSCPALPDGTDRTCASCGKAIGADTPAQNLGGVWRHPLCLDLKAAQRKYEETHPQARKSLLDIAADLYTNTFRPSATHRTTAPAHTPISGAALLVATTSVLDVPGPLSPSDPRFQELHGLASGELKPTLLTREQLIDKLAAMGVTTTSALGRHALAGGALFDVVEPAHVRLDTPENVDKWGSSAAQPIANSTPFDHAADAYCGPA